MKCSENICIKVHAWQDKEALINVLVRSGYKVWQEEEKKTFGSDIYICAEYIGKDNE